METSISTELPKRLLTTGAYGESHVDEFCRLLAGRLSDTITPLHFLLAYSLLISDVENAQDRFVVVGNERKHTFIGGLPLGFIYRISMTRIIERVFPKEFADECLKEHKSVLDEMGTLDAYRESKG